jgi:hypothetical protein
LEGAFQCHQLTQQVTEMLYDNRQLGRLGLGTRLALRFKALFDSKRHADLDLLSMNRHLQRDLGLSDRELGVRLEDTVWRK